MLTKKLPMNNSTFKCNNVDKKGKEVKASPQKATLDFLRNFARMYRVEKGCTGEIVQIVS